MRLNVDDDLIEVAKGLGPLIGDHAAETERQRRLARPVVEALAGAGLFRMLTPRPLGGLEVDPLTCARVIEEVAGFDSAAGWALMVGNSVDWWCCRLPKEGPEEIYADDPDAVIAAAFHPPMEATRVEGGYRVSGRRPLASNIHDATWLMVTALVMDGEQPRTADGAPEAIGVIVRAELRPIDLAVWSVLGVLPPEVPDELLALPLSARWRLLQRLHTPAGGQLSQALARLPAADREVLRAPDPSVLEVPRSFPINRRRPDRCVIRAGSGGRCDGESDGDSDVSHPVVIGDDSSEVAADQLRRCDMDRVKASKDRPRRHRCGSVEQVCVEVDLMQPRQLAARLGDGGCAAG